MCKQDPTLKFCYPSADSGGSGGSGGNGSTPAAPGPVMKMYFFSDMPFYLLFKSWTPRTNADLIAAWFAIFFLGVFYEFLQMVYGKKEAEFWARRSARHSAAMAAAAAAATQRRLDEESGIPLGDGVVADKDTAYSCCNTPPPRQVASPTGKSCCGGGSTAPSRPDSAASFDRTAGMPYKGSRGSRRGVLGVVGAYMQPELVAMDIVRGVARFVLAGLAYLLMLAAMCFNVAIFFSVITGVGVGSMLFGRWRWSSNVAEGYSHCGCGSS